MIIKLVVGEREFPLGWEVVEALASRLPDAMANGDLLDGLAQSESSSVRAAVASNRTISAETVAMLARDLDLEVVENLINSNPGRISREDVQQIVDRNSARINRQIAERVERFNDADIMVLAHTLCQSRDPSVREPWLRTLRHLVQLSRP